MIAELENIDDECDMYGIQMVKLKDPPLAKRFVAAYRPSPLSLVEECRDLALIGRELHSVEILFVSFAGSLWRMDRWPQCTERSF